MKHLFLSLGIIISAFSFAGDKPHKKHRKVHVQYQVHPKGKRGNSNKASRDKLQYLKGKTLYVDTSVSVSHKKLEPKVTLI